MTNITINILNCGCGCGEKSTGGGATGGWTIEPPYNDLGDPQLPSGPPEGYLLPSGLADRQCKMAVWLYSWLESSVDTLGNTAEGNAMLTVAKTLKLVPFGKILVPVVSAFVVFVIELFVTPGLTPDDAFVTYMAWGIAYGIVGGLANVSTTYITQPAFQDALPIIQANKEEIICQLAQASNAAQARERLETALADKLQTEQRALVLSFIPDMFLTMLFFTPNWWPSFDDDYLAGIADTCCGGLENDTPLLLGSGEACQASYYIIEQLAVTMQRVAALGGIWADFNPFDDNRESIYDRVTQYANTPTKIRERAYNYNAFLQAVTEHIYSQYWWLTSIGTGPQFISLTDWQSLADYLTTNKAALTAALQAAADTTEANTALDAVRTWIDDTNNVDDEDVQLWMLAALDALVNPPVNKAGILDLLFYQDADLANYAAVECGGGGGGDEYYLTAITDVEILKPNAVITDQNEFLGAEDSADDIGGMWVQSAGNDGIFARLTGDFGQVYVDAVQLELRVRGSTEWPSWRLLDSVTLSVKENLADEWVGVGVVYVNQASLSDGVWQWRIAGFAARNVRYVLLSFNRGQGLGYNGFRWFDALKVVTQ